MSEPQRARRVLISAECFLPAVNGVTNSVLRVANYLDSCGYEIRIVAPEPGPREIKLDSGRCVVVDRVRSMRVPRYKSLTFATAAVSTVRRSIESFDPDIVHLAAPVLLGRRVGALAKALGVPSVALFQTDLSGFASNYGLTALSRPLWNFLRRIHNRADLTLAPTDVLAHELRRRNFDHVDVWGRGVDHAQFSPSRRSNELREMVGAGDSSVLVGYIGRLAAEKKVERLAHLRDIPNVTLLVVGDGPERRRLERALPGAHFTGFLEGDELGTAMASLDIFVHTGEHETFCQTVQEAMACGVPVVAPAAGGPINLVEHGHSGWLYGPGNMGEMRAHVARLANDPAERKRFGQIGQELVEARSWESLGGELLANYDQAVAAAGAAW